ncbi:hypothetical protein KP806_24205, partial [Paenibacillus sp. N4]|uniref:hypothetical protein n=1 Tax=Paenibacillus vietnamensis TaxID=2590547 RepID=UPI001CD153C7
CENVKLTVGDSRIKGPSRMCTVAPINLLHVRFLMQFMQRNGAMVGISSYAAERSNGGHVSALQQ